MMTHQVSLNVLFRQISDQSHLIPIYQVMLGYLHQISWNARCAVECYAVGSLVDQRYLSYDKVVQCSFHPWTVFIDNAGV